MTQIGVKPESECVRLHNRECDRKERASLSVTMHTNSRRACAVSAASDSKGAAGNKQISAETENDP